MSTPTAPISLCGAPTAQGPACRRVIRSGRCPDHGTTRRAVRPTDRRPVVVTTDPFTPTAGTPAGFAPEVLAADRRSRETAVDLYADHFEMTPVEVRDMFDAGRDTATRLLGQDRRYVHFTDAAGAAGIARTSRLWGSRSIEASVFAVPAGGAHQPTVQRGTTSRTGFGRVIGGRHHAVVFTAPAAPDVLSPEECIWRRAFPLHVAAIEVVDAHTATALLDDTLSIPDPWARP